MRGLAVVLVSLALVPAAAARPLLGVYGDAGHFQSLTGQQSAVGHIFLGWGQGSQWGGPFDRFIPKLGRVPMISFTADKSGREAITPLQIANGAGDDYLIAMNNAIARAAKPLFYVRPLPEMTGWWTSYCAYTRSGHAKGAAYSTAAYRKAFARMYLLLHGGTAAQLDARLARLGLPGVQTDLPSNPFPRLRVIWGAQAHGDPQVAGNQPAGYYPGDAYVDVVGDDPYDLGAVDWSAIDRLYAAHPHKGFAFPEWGLRAIDDAGFVQRMSSFVRTHGRVELLAFFNGKTGGTYDLASKPAARTAYRRLITPLGG